MENIYLRPIQEVCPQKISQGSALQTFRSRCCGPPRCQSPGPQFYCQSAPVILCVNTVEYGRRGIASKLVELSMENARALGCTGALATLTAYASQCLFLKAKFEILKVINHEAFVDDNGKRLINCKDGTNKGQLVFKRIAQ